MVAGGCLRVEEGASRPLRDHVAVSSWEEGARRGHQGSAAFSGGSRVVPCVWADDGPDECKRRRTRQTRFHSEQEGTQASTISASDCAKETGYHDAGCDRRRSRRRHRRRRRGSAKVQRGGRGGALPPATAVGVTLRDVGLGAGSRTAVQGTTAADAAGRWGRRGHLPDRVSPPLPPPSLPPLSWPPEADAWSSGTPECRIAAPLRCRHYADRLVIDGGGGAAGGQREKRDSGGWGGGGAEQRAALGGRGRRRKWVVRTRQRWWCRSW